MSRPKPTFACRLEQARKAAGLSQRALGIALGYAPESASPRMNQYERGRREPDFSTARQIADRLNVPLAYLFCEEDELAELILVFARSEENARKKFYEWLASNSADD